MNYDELKVSPEKAVELIESQRVEIDHWKDVATKQREELDFANKKLSKLRFMMTTLNDIMKARVNNVDEIIELIDSKPEVKEEKAVEFEGIAKHIPDLPELLVEESIPYQDGRPLQLTISHTEPRYWDSEETGRTWDMFTKDAQYRANLDWKTLDYIAYNNFGEPIKVGRWDNSGDGCVRLFGGWRLEKKHKRPNFIKILVLETYESFGYTIEEGTELIAALGTNQVYRIALPNNQVDSVAEYNDGKLFIYNGYACSEVYLTDPRNNNLVDGIPPKAIAVKTGKRFYIGDDITVFEKGVFCLAEKVEEDGKVLYYATDKELNVSIQVASWNKHTNRLTFVLENQFEVYRTFFGDAEPKLPPSRVKVKIKQDMYVLNKPGVKSFEKDDVYVAFLTRGGNYETTDELGDKTVVGWFNKTGYKVVPSVNAFYEIVKEME
ncbi:hypothetical protein [Bacillus phage YungSlug]|nr:hypothetical protein [Bacillus phage YungSlug]